jgi:putative transposase
LWGKDSHSTWINTPGPGHSDNGPEFVAEHLTDWLATLDVGCALIAPASPWENAYVETWHDKLRDELLNEELLITPQEARIVIADWINHYNHDRPHSRPGNQTPATVRYAALDTPTLTSVDQKQR